MNSAFYLKEKEKYASLVTYFQQAKQCADECPDIITNCQKYIGELTIGGEAMDKGIVNDKTNNLVMKISSTLSSLISECDSNISKNNQLYSEALRREKEKLRNKESKE